MTKEIQEALCKMLILKGRQAVCENFGYHVAEMDVAVLSQSGLLHEYEVKISRSDFLADKKKRKFQYYDQRIYCPNYFYYVCPEGLIQKNEIPKWAGLYYYDGSEFRLKQGVKRLHNKPVENIEKVLIKMLRLNVERKYLGCSGMTYKNRESQKQADNFINELIK